MHNELCQRLLSFSLRIAKMADAMPVTTASRNGAGQIIRSSSSAAANYRASQRGRSRKDFTNKVGIALEEADETEFWLEYIEGLEVLSPRQLDGLKIEANELVRILASIRKTG